MLALILAAAITQSDPRIREVLTICDTPTLTKACGLYLSGYVDALQAHEDLGEMARQAGVKLPMAVCFDGGADLNGIRQRVVAELKGAAEGAPARIRVMTAITAMYSCASGGSQGKR